MSEKKEEQVLLKEQEQENVREEDTAINTWHPRLSLERTQRITGTRIRRNKILGNKRTIIIGTTKWQDTTFHFILLYIAFLVSCKGEGMQHRKRKMVIVFLWETTRTKQVILMIQVCNSLFHAVRGTLLILLRDTSVHFRLRLINAKWSQDNGASDEITQWMETKSWHENVLFFLTTKNLFFLFYLWRLFWVK